MNSFGEKGQVGNGDAMAALAIVRALLRHMKADGKLRPSDIETIADDALSQIPPGNNPGKEDARHLLGELKDSARPPVVKRAP
jgi:hypothetical protein